MRMSLAEMQAIANSTNFQFAKSYKEQAAIIRENNKAYEIAYKERIAAEQAENVYT